MHDSCHPPATDIPNPILKSHSFAITVIYDALLAKNLLTNPDFIAYDLIDFVTLIFAEHDDGGSLTELAHGIFWTQDELSSGNFTRLVPGLIDVKHGQKPNFARNNHITIFSCGL